MLLIVQDSLADTATERSTQIFQIPHLVLTIEPFAKGRSNVHLKQSQFDTISRLDF